MLSIQFRVSEVWYLFFNRCSLEIRNRKDAESGRYGREGPDATLTAASLIDAIITHQINQPSVHDRQSPIPSSRTGDRLFASFQRCVQPSGVGLPQQSHLSPNRPQIERVERPHQSNDELRMEEEQRNPQGTFYSTRLIGPSLTTLSSLLRVASHLF